MLGMAVEVKMPCKEYRDWHFDMNGRDRRAEAAFLHHELQKNASRLPSFQEEIRSSDRRAIFHRIDFHPLCI